MKTFHITLILFAISAGCFGQNSKDDDALKKLPARWEQYWNSHDMDSMGTMLAKDVDFVNVAGLWMRGREAAVKDHKEKHQGIIFKNSVWATEEISVKHIKPDLAILHIRWGIKGDNEPDGTPRTPRHGIFTWVASKVNGQWLLLAVHNVNIRESGAFTK